MSIIPILRTCAYDQLQRTQPLILNRGNIRGMSDSSLCYEGIQLCKSAVFIVSTVIITLTVFDAAAQDAISPSIQGVGWSCNGVQPLESLFWGESDSCKKKGENEYKEKCKDECKDECKQECKSDCENERKAICKIKCKRKCTKKCKKCKKECKKKHENSEGSNSDFLCLERDGTIDYRALKVKKLKRPMFRLGDDYFFEKNGHQMLRSGNKGSDSTSAPFVVIFHDDKPVACGPAEKNKIYDLTSISHLPSNQRVEIRTYAPLLHGSESSRFDSLRGGYRKLLEDKKAALQVDIDSNCKFISVLTDGQKKPKCDHGDAKRIVDDNSLLEEWKKIYELAKEVVANLSEVSSVEILCPQELRERRFCSGEGLNSELCKTANLIKESIVSKDISSAIVAMRIASKYIQEIYASMIEPRDEKKLNVQLMIDALTFDTDECKKQCLGDNGIGKKELNDISERCQKGCEQKEKFVIDTVNLLKSIRVNLSMPPDPGVDEKLVGLWEKVMAKRKEAGKMYQQATEDSQHILFIENWLAEEDMHRWIGSYEMPLFYRGKPIGVLYGAGTEETVSVEGGERIDLLVSDVPYGQSLSLQRSEGGEDSSMENFLTMAEVAIPILMKYAGVAGVTESIQKGVSADEDLCPPIPPEAPQPDSPFYFLGPKEILPLSNHRVAYLQSRGAERGETAQILICDGVACEEQDENGNIKKPKDPKTIVNLTTVWKRWGGFTFFLDGSANVGTDKTMGKPVYKKRGEPVGGQQLYSLDYSDAEGWFSMSLMVAARFRISENRHWAFATGPTLVPGKDKVKFQWNIVLALEAFHGLFITCGAGFRQREDLHTDSDLGQTISLPEDADRPAFTDTESGWTVVGLVGISLDLGALGSASVKLIQGMGEGGE